ncbi:MAG: hypothetical protein NTW65_04140 [Deltaproteobacteria bacterium]|nr:hypothetical protein [Deltaproteobacteria bacterium]
MGLVDHPGAALFDCDWREFRGFFLSRALFKVNGEMGILEGHVLDLNTAKEQIPGQEVRGQAIRLHGIAVVAAQGNLFQCHPVLVQDIYLEVLDHNLSLKLGLECSLYQIAQCLGPQIGMVDGHTPYHDYQENPYGYNNLLCASLHYLRLFNSSRIAR